MVRIGREKERERERGRGREREREREGRVICVSGSTYAAVAVARHDRQGTFLCAKQHFNMRVEYHYGFAAVREGCGTDVRLSSHLERQRKPKKTNKMYKKKDSKGLLLGATY